MTGGDEAVSGKSKAQATGQVVVRPMRWWDIAQVHALESLAFQDTAWSPETFWSELAGVPHSRYYVVAVRRELVVAYAGLSAVGPEADIQTLAVAAASQGQGVGAGMLDALLVEARRRGCTRITLEVAAPNKRAQRFYLRHGFTQIARRSGYYGPGADALILRLPLGRTRELRGSTPP